MTLPNLDLDHKNAKLRRSRKKQLGLFSKNIDIKELGFIYP